TTLCPYTTLFRSSDCQATTVAPRRPLPRSNRAWHERRSARTGSPWNTAGESHSSCRPLKGPSSMAAVPSTPAPGRMERPGSTPLRSKSIKALGAVATASGRGKQCWQPTATSSHTTVRRHVAGRIPAHKGFTGARHREDRSLHQRDLAPLLEKQPPVPVQPGPPPVIALDQY